ncbi:ABC transporter permease [Umezawaea tangerina]|uniref:ABC-2 type transport system permease protein n=1 Tax=Umezawaea tangerina TaxID=84725 RepID=A0A2T0SRP8_9PSEU|nr:ABC transporter permease [Umezawaea tangerina]PRY36080.1 ABC-2 type transport system permease protein [Umezawaea tangerina]
MILALGRTELKLLLRNKTAAGIAVVTPLLIGALLLTNEVLEWTFTITVQLVLMLGFTVYMTVTTSLVARRQDLYLKRLRTGEASDATVVVGLLVPIALLGLVQTALLLGMSTAAGAPLPDRPLLLVLAVVGGVAMCCAAGVATTAITSTAELGQITTAPFFFTLFGGAAWTMVSDPVDLRMLALPGGQIAELVKAAWGGSTEHVPVAVAALAAWTAVGYFAATRVFRWEPRG